MAIHEDSTVAALRETLCSESAPLAKRFRALFSLKHLASQPSNPQVIPAIHAIAAAFESPSALLKHELAIRAKLRANEFTRFFSKACMICAGVTSHPGDHV